VKSHGKSDRHVRFEVLTAVVVKSSIFWDITPCSPLSVNRRFGGTCRLHHLDNKQTSVGFGVLTALVMKRTIFWDITPCSPLSVNRRFGGTCRLHLLDNKQSSVGFEVLIALVMKSSIFWDITPCSPLSVNRRFRGTCRLHLGQVIYRPTGGCDCVRPSTVLRLVWTSLLHSGKCVTAVFLGWSAVTFHSTC
jgi:hypothetical protein